MMKSEDLKKYTDWNDNHKEYIQMSLFPPDPVPQDSRKPITITWNCWHGCTKVSPGCLHCYMFRRDISNGKDPSSIKKTNNFNLPIRKLRSGEYKGRYKIPSGSLIYTCFSSDFFHEKADEWRPMAWDMIRERPDCTFFMITKRPERIIGHLPSDWKEGWDHVQIAVTCENQWAVDHRLPIYLVLPIRHRSVMVEPMLSAVNLVDYFQNYPDTIESISVGGESGPNARPCDYNWVLELHQQCLAYDVGFYYHQTGAKLIKDGKTYYIPRRLQHEQAWKAGLDYR